MLFRDQNSQFPERRELSSDPRDTELAEQLLQQNVALSKNGSRKQIFPSPQLHLWAALAERNWYISELENLLTSAQIDFPKGKAMSLMHSQGEGGIEELIFSDLGRIKYLNPLIKENEYLRGELKRYLTTNQLAVQGLLSEGGAVLDIVKLLSLSLNIFDSRSNWADMSGVAVESIGAIIGSAIYERDCHIDYLEGRLRDAKQPVPRRSVKNYTVQMMEERIEEVILGRLEQIPSIISLKKENEKLQSCLITSVSIDRRVIIDSKNDYSENPLQNHTSSLIGEIAAFDGGRVDEEYLVKGALVCQPDISGELEFVDSPKSNLESKVMLPEEIRILASDFDTSNQDRADETRIGVDETEITNLRFTLTELGMENESLRQQLARRNSEIEISNKKLNALKSKHKERENQAHKRIVELECQVAELRKCSESKDSAAQVTEKAVARLEELNQQLRAQVESLSVIISEKDARLLELSKGLEESVKTKELLLTQLEQQREELEISKEKNVALLANLQAAERLIQERGSQVEQQRRGVDKRDQEVKEIELLCEELRAESQKKTEDLHELKLAHDTLMERYATLKSWNNSQQSELRDSRELVKSLRTTCDKFKERIEATRAVEEDRLRERTKYQSEIVELKTQLNSLKLTRAQLGKLNEITISMTQVREERNALDMKLQSSLNKAAHLEELVRTRDGIIEAQKVKLKALEFFKYDMWAILNQASKNGALEEVLDPERVVNLLNKMDELKRDIAKAEQFREKKLAELEALTIHQQAD